VYHYVKKKKGVRTLTTPHTPLQHTYNPKICATQTHRPTTTSKHKKVTTPQTPLQHTYNPKICATQTHRPTTTSKHRQINLQEALGRGGASTASINARETLGEALKCI
jgi:hypothetical protein